MMYGNTVTRLLYELAYYLHAQLFLEIILVLRINYSKESVKASFMVIVCVCVCLSVYVFVSVSVCLYVCVHTCVSACTYHHVVGMGNKLMILIHMYSCDN